MIPLERRSDEDRSHSSREQCPNCRAAFSDPDSLVCIRCGFDLKDLKQQQTTVGEESGAEIDPELDETAGHEAPVLTLPGRGDQWLPLVLAGGALLILLAAYLGGAPGLYPLLTRQAEFETISWGARLLGIAQFVIVSIMLYACAAAGLVLTGLTLPKPVGPWRLAAARLAAIVLLTQLIKLITLPGPRSLEWAVEAILQGAVFIMMTAALFALPATTVGLIGAWSLLCLLGLWVFAHAVTWAM